MSPQLPAEKLFPCPLPEAQGGRIVLEGCAQRVSTDPRAAGAPRPKPSWMVPGLASALLAAWGLVAPFMDGMRESLSFILLFILICNQYVTYFIVLSKSPQHVSEPLNHVSPRQFIRPSGCEL